MSDLLTIDGFVIDLAVSIREGAEAEATKFPVERGAPTTDHVINSSRTLELEFLVSDTPIGDVFAVRSAGAIPSAEARAFLEELRDSKRAFVVEYGDRRWEDQIFASLDFEEGADKSGGLFATARLEKIGFVDVRRVVVERAVERAVVASPKLPGRKMWLCPAGTPVSKSDAENKRNKCRQIEQQFGYYRFADNGVALTDAELSRLGTQTFNEVTGLNVPGDIEWNPKTKQWERRAAPVTVTKHELFEKFLGVPPDYTPPTPDPSIPDDLETRSYRGRNI
jgi:hypothetical protein